MAAGKINRSTPAGMVNTILQRQADMDSPEACLWLAVIRQAVVDLLSDNYLVRESSDAYNFLMTDRLNPVAAAVGLNASFIRSLVSRGMDVDRAA